MTSALGTAASAGPFDGGSSSRPATSAEGVVAAAPPPARRILFVDDDAQLRAALANAMRKHRHRWAMVFVGSGEDALAELRLAPFDVVVSDMRMPVMDGAALLARVQEEAPTTIRMILSGFSDRDAIVRALPVAHQFFNKPCDLGELARAIDRACELRALFGRPALRAVVEKLGASPTAPRVYHELAAMLGRSDVTVEAIATVVEQDAALCRRVRQVASARPGGSEGEREGPIAGAVAQLGLEALIGLALASHTATLAGDHTAPEPEIVELGRHSLEIARAARRLATSYDTAADAFIAGLVHDIGKIVIATALPEDHATLVRLAEQPGAVSHDIERRVLGTTHAEIGAYLLGLWGLPLPIVEAIAHHDDAETQETPVLSALRAAHAAISAIRK